MKIYYIYLLFAVNYVMTVVAYYKKCYDEFSVCLITNTDDPRHGSEFRLSRESAVNWCKRNSSSLAIITNASVQTAIEAFLNDSSAKLNSDVITNAHRYFTPYWQWTDGRRSVGTYYPFSHIDYGYLLVSTGRGVTLNASIPTTARNFICFHLNRNSSCPNDNHQLGNNCYKIHRNEAISWFDARIRCLQEGYDLATFGDIYLSNISPWLSNGEYWIGLRSEIWQWGDGQMSVDKEIKYSNWDSLRPNAAGGNCLCLTANTGKWKDCGFDEHRYICITGYTPDSSAAPASTTKTTTTTTTRTTPLSTPATFRSTLHIIHSVFHSTPVPLADDNSMQTDRERYVTWLGISLAICATLLSVAMTYIIFTKIRKRKKRTVQTKSPLPPVRDELQSSTGAYEMLRPGEQTGNKTYVELQLYETIEYDTKQDTKNRNIPNNMLYSNVG